MDWTLLRCGCRPSAIPSAPDSNARANFYQINKTMYNAGTSVPVHDVVFPFSSSASETDARLVLETVR